MRVEFWGCRAGMGHPHVPEPRRAVVYRSPGISISWHQHCIFRSPSWSYAISSFPFSRSFEAVIKHCFPYRRGTSLLAGRVYKRYPTAENDFTSCCCRDFKLQQSGGIHRQHWNPEPTAERRDFYRDHIKRCEDAEHWKHPSGRGEFWDVGDQSNQFSLQSWTQAFCGHQSVLAYPDSHFPSCLSVGKQSTGLDLGLRNPSCCFIHKRTQVPWEKKWQVFWGRNCPFRCPNAVNCRSCYIICASP